MWRVAIAWLICAPTQESSYRRMPCHLILLGVDEGSAAPQHSVEAISPLGGIARASSRQQFFWLESIAAVHHSVKPGDVLLVTSCAQPAPRSSSTDNAPCAIMGATQPTAMKLAGTRPSAGLMASTPPPTAEACRSRFLWVTARSRKAASAGSADSA